MESSNQIADDQTFYISITGLRIRRFWHRPIFARHAMASMAQAKQAPGCISADARSIDGVHHTLSVWSSKADMLKFIHSDAHARASKIFRKIATGKTFGYPANEPPGWSEVHTIWKERGRD